MDTKQEIIDYINQKSNNGALLVTGKWGCGKTYLIQNIASNLNNSNEYLAVSISLFGIDSIEVFHNEIKNKVFFSRGFDKTPDKLKKQLNKVKDFALTTSTILGEHFKIAKSINAALTVRWQDFFFVEKFISCYNFANTSENDNKIIKKELILFFDDFERSKIDRIDLMGAINSYSENKNIKVIIIADEDKIKSTNNNDKDNKYEEFKEKLVSRTVQIKYDYQNAIESIVNSYTETTEGYKDFLKTNIETIHKVFTESQVENLRSVKAFITDYERVYTSWHNSNVPLGLEVNVFYMFGAMLFGVKGGFYKEGEYGYIFSDVHSKDLFSKWSSTYELYSIQKWITKGIWDEQVFLDEIQSKFNPLNLGDVEIFLLYSFWDLEQSNIEIGLPEAVQKAYNGELIRDQLISLLQKVHTMKEYSIPLPCIVDYSKIKDGFEKRKKLVLSNQIEEPKRRRFAEKAQIDEEAYNIYKDIENFDKKLYELEPRNRFVGYLNLVDGINSYEFRGKIIGCFDTDLLALFIQRYLKSDNANKRDLCFILMDLSFTDKEYLTIEERKETISNFQKLIKTLLSSDQNDNDFITATINKEFSKRIEEKIQEITDIDKI
ncbi:MAG: hypothetical protein IJV48_02405 [Ruminococcus sp.]|nr:hypothetical protein [Ruminococcus sp.]